MPLQKEFRGLPDFLGMFQGGGVAAEWGGIVTPTIQIEDFLQPPEWVTGTLAVTNLGDAANVALTPEDTAYRLWHFGFQTTTVVAHTGITMSASITLPDGTSIGLLYPNNNQTPGAFPAANRIYSGAAHFPRGIWVPEGSRINFFNEVLTGAGTTNFTYASLVSKIKQ